MQIAICCVRSSLPPPPSPRSRPRLGRSPPATLARRHAGRGLQWVILVARHRRLRPAAARGPDRRHRARSCRCPGPRELLARALHQPRDRRRLRRADPGPRAGHRAGRAAATAPLYRRDASAHRPMPISRCPPWCCRSAFFLLVRNLGLHARRRRRPSWCSSPTRCCRCPSPWPRWRPPLDAIARSRGKLIRSLGLGGWTQFGRCRMAADRPRRRRRAGARLLLFARRPRRHRLFGTEDFATLPLLMYRALGAYRTNDAAAIAALMLVAHHRRLRAAAQTVRKADRCSHADRLAFTYPGADRHYELSFSALPGEVTAVSGAQRVRQIHPARPGRRLPHARRAAA